MARPVIDIEVWAEDTYDLPNAQTTNKIRPIDDLWSKGYDMGQKPDVQAWNYVWNMQTQWMKYFAEEQIPGLENIYLKRTNNLSDLQDKAASRTNLVVYSKTETDSRYLQLIGGTLTGGLKIVGSGGNESIFTQGLSLRWNETVGSGASYFVNNQGSGAGGFIFRNVNSDNTVETGRLTITADGSLVTAATVRAGALQSTGNATVAATTTTANLVVNNNNATVGGRNVVRSVNNATADGNGNVTLSFPEQGVMGIRLGTLQSFRERAGTERMPGGVMTAWADFGDSTYWVYLRPLQYLINGSWVTVSYT